MFWTEDNVRVALKDCEESIWSASSILHVQLDLKFLNRDISGVYRSIFKGAGVTSESLKLCGLLAKEIVRRKLNT